MRKVILGLLLVAIGLSVAVIAAVPANETDRRAAAHKDMQAGNFKDAYDAFSSLALDPKSDPKLVGGDLRYAVDCLQRLGRTGEADAFREKAIAGHKDNWRLLWQAAMSYHNGTENWGFIVAGQFERGNHRGNAGRHVSSADRDRVRAMQLMSRGMPLALKDVDKAEASQFFFTFADILVERRSGDGAWRLQDLTDLAAPLPDYEDMNTGRGYWNGFGNYNGRGAPVNEDGSPLFHAMPKSWEDAKSDGERYRWCLLQAAELDATSVPRARIEFAQFLQSQFDVTTMLYGYGRHVPYPSADPDGEGDDDEKPNETGPFAVSTLGEDETIARLAGGTKRFKLPDEFNFIKLYKDVLATKSGYATQAASALGQIFEDRQQYPRAAEFWRAGIEFNDGNKPSFEQRLNQIVGNWGMFEGARTLPAGVEPKLPFVFRNATKVTFEAREIDVAKFLTDLKAYFKSSPNQLDWQLTQPDEIGRRIIHLGQDQYVGKQVAQWEMPLKPREKHFDRRVMVQTPLKKAGAYLVTATMDGGNVSRIVLWVADTTLVKKTLAGGSYYFVADAATGKPVPNAKLDFFGWIQHHVGDNKYKVETSEFTAQAGPDGQLMLTPEKESSRFQWLVTATAEGGRFAHFGYTSVWAHPADVYDRQYNEQKLFVITDRPVFRPGQTVKFKFWASHAKYDEPGKSPFAGQTLDVWIGSPKDEVVLEQKLVADAYGGISGELVLGKDATLGVYSMRLLNVPGGGTFRVEEYKKPEFEVTVEAPTEPVMLGEKITATIKSKYYFGTPVTGAKVKYKVLRSEHDAQWFPEAAWDWFYGKGYWWFGQDYDWYPGWRHWGCIGPAPWWWHRPQAQPEVVSENEVPVGPDGTVKVEIDTAMAKAIHADSDHRYEITAEVTDQSRRTITGTGTVSVARKPFKVYAWVDRGYYKAGDVIRAEFAAQTLDQKPVKGAGELKLLAISYDADLKPTERVVETWQLGTDDRGRAAQAIKTAQPGQYRLSYTVTDDKKHAIEGGYVFVVRNEGFDGAEFRFNDVEIVADKREYQPGDKVRLMINTSRPDSTVVLFIRPTSGVYLPPKLVRMNGKSTVEEIEVAQRDMPNFFVEAFTVAEGKIYEQTKELVVPPESRVLNVEVLPDAQRYKPGQRAKVKIRVTDAHGEPVVGSAVVSLYDKSVEYISGGTNVPEIREAFWKWRRTHDPRTETNLSRRTYHMPKPDEEGFGYLGRFGQLVSNLPLGDAEFFALRQNEGAATDRFYLGGGGGGGLFAASGALPAAPGAPMGRAAGFKKGEAQNGAMEFDALKMAKDKSGIDGPGGPPELVQPNVRKNFADTALWLTSLDVKDNGVAQVELDMPENLTTWKARVWVMSDGTRVGQGTAEVVTAKDLIVRLQAPRFFVQKDEVVLSANVHNYLATTKDVSVSLELEGGTLTPDGELTQVVQVSPSGEKRVDWRVKVNSPGAATVRVLAKTDEESDAMQLSFPVYVHGMLKTDSFSGGIRPGDGTASLTYRIPEERIPEHSRVEIRYSPSVATAMVDALPYLVDYPYGCTEQTLNRFVPTVITQRVLLGMGLDLKDIRDKRTNLNAQEIGDDAKRAEDWKRNNPPNPGVPERNPVFVEAEVKAMVLAGVTKLSNQQLSDGGWGWFSGFGEHSTPHTTATVLHGLQVARANDASVPANVIERGIAWLKTYEAEQLQRLKNWPTKTIPYKEHADNLDALVFMVLSDEKQVNAEMRDFLYRDRNELSVYCLAQLGLAFQQQDGQADKLAMVLKNLSQYVVKDAENQTAYLQLPGSQSYWWYWYGSDTEANAYYLKLLARTDGKGPVAPGLAKYMINNRKHASYWNSTRDTALCIEALAEFIKASGEDKPDMTVAVSIDGKKVKEVAINAANFFSFDNKVVIDGLAVPAGEHRVEFTRTGSGPLYFNAYVTNFTLEDPIKKAGLEIKVQRQFYRMVPVEKKEKVSGSRGQSVDQKVESHRREPLKDGDVLTSGDLVEVELEIDSKNDYEYVLFEDMKASGFEPVDTQSGYNGNDLNAYMELRDERVCFFARTLARGKNSVAYRLRAEIPGTFHALPTRASAMYAPELKANSDEAKLGIVDAKVTE